MPRDFPTTATAPAPDAAPTSHAYREFVGHELRSPLTAIHTALAALAEDLGAGEGMRDAVRMLEIALRNTRRLEDTVNWHLQVLEQNDPALEPADVPPATAQGGDEPTG